MCREQQERAAAAAEPDRREAVQTADIAVPVVLVGLLTEAPEASMATTLAEAGLLDSLAAVPTTT